MKYFPAILSNRRLHPEFPIWHDHTPYIYFLIKNGRIIYIGKSHSIRTRLHNHNCYVKPDFIRLIKCSARTVDKYEKRWIRKFKPRLNFMVYDGVTKRSYHNGYDYRSDSAQPLNYCWTKTNGCKCPARLTLKSK